MAATTVVGSPYVSPARAADLETADPNATLVAYLDGKPLALKLVSNYYCDDFAYPVIECSIRPASVEARAALTLLAGNDYVTIYEQSNYSGTYMNVSQDYPTLITIGWNDRISSFKARNSETGRFWTDWFNGGSSWPFCCNSQLSSLGAYDNTFSAVQRT
jgi:hypothetical protein